MTFYLILYLPVVAALALMVGLAMSGSRQMLLGTVSLSTFALFIWGSLNWLLRDGLGPDSVPSDGYEAWLRFFEGGFWLPLLTWSILVASAIFIYRLKQSRNNAA
jgi:hypothetical protein